MDTKLASIELTSPHGRGEDEPTKIVLDKERLTVGRTAAGSVPDVVLSPDPQRWVGRLHCILERGEGNWWLMDNGTVNGTLLRWRDGKTGRVGGRTRLASGDAILILGGMTEEGEPQYWRLGFSDPDGTQEAGVGVGQGGGPRTCLEYDWVQARVYRRQQDGERTEVGGLRPAAHKLIRYMTDKSRKNDGVPVACSHEELIRAIWDGEPDERRRQDLRYVVRDLRREIEPDRQNPCLLETILGFGYRLIVCEGRS